MTPVASASCQTPSEIRRNVPRTWTRCHRSPLGVGIWLTVCKGMASGWAGGFTFTLTHCVFGTCKSIKTGFLGSLSASPATPFTRTSASIKPLRCSRLLVAFNTSAASRFPSAAISKLACPSLTLMARTTPVISTQLPSSALAARRAKLVGLASGRGAEPRSRNTARFR